MTSTTSSGEEARVLVHHLDGVAHIWLNRPDHHNTMTAEMLLDLAAAFDAIGRGSAARAVVLSGKGSKTFCAGGQLTSSKDGNPFSLNPEQFDNPVALLFRAMDRCNVPIIGRINGSAYGGGVGLVAACDIAIGVDGASYGTTEARVGVFPLMILPLLMRVVPHRQLVEMCLYAERFPASEAKALGLLNRVVPANELDAAIQDVLKKLAKNSPTALAFGRRSINTVADLSLSDALNQTQALLPLLAASKDAQEGFRAFAERREPTWTR
ncbi:enoyl-CoA hydratase-related protein [Hydrogenophaga sp. BPS33]|uniref:enoyl-CoA hydratase-related protein n=1 Tax=Hydrogenophaga sp. BPS33 TaxID=2651974 RepID=UPI00131F70A2|nr:enoyl-CoA hydratase-related protein [Hydrogenophaga sp. BPS33]QHE87510.1 enoyl-CoA hydratase [Hydrogenophaga sp. BPS33]